MLGGDDLHHRARLRLAARQHPVDAGAALAHPALGELVADRRERAAQGLADVLVAVVDAGDQAGVVPVVDQQCPVVGRGRVAMLLPHGYVVGEPQQSGVLHPQRGVRQQRLLGRDPVEPHLAGEPSVDPGQERHRPEGGVEQLGGELGEPLVLVGEPLGLRGRRCGQPDQVGERRQVALAHHRRDRCGVDDVTEQLVDQHGLVGAQGGGRGRGQAEHGGVGQQLQELAQQPAPDLEEVVALVEDQRDRPGLLERAHQRLAVGVQAVELRGGRLRFVLGVVLLVVEDRQGLVGQGGHRRGQVAVRADLDRVGAARVAEVAPAADPLPLDRRVGAEHDRAPALAPDRLETDQRLAGTRRQHHPRALPTLGAGPGQRLECLALVASQRVRVGQRRELRGHSEAAASARARRSATIRSGSSAE